MKKQTIMAGYGLILASVTFWICWFLMPDPGTVDTVHILEIVKRSRTAVFSSVIIQMISSVLYVITLFQLLRLSHPPKRIANAGIILLGVGTLGLYADSYFHLLAYFMTDDTVIVQRDVVKVMGMMQTEGVIFLLPALLPFFIGGIILAFGLNKQSLIQKRPGLVLLGSVLLGLIGELVVHKICKYRIPNLMLIVLAVFAAGRYWQELNW